jgi:hypothetical protein
MTYPQVIVEYMTGGKTPAQYHTAQGRPRPYSDQQDAEYKPHYSTSMNHMQLKIWDDKFDILMLTF